MEKASLITFSRTRSVRVSSIAIRGPLSTVRNTSQVLGYNYPLEQYAGFRWSRVYCSGTTGGADAAWWKRGLSDGIHKLGHMLCSRHQSIESRTRSGSSGVAPGSDSGSQGKLTFKSLRPGRPRATGCLGELGRLNYQVRGGLPKDAM